MWIRTGYQLIDVSGGILKLGNLSELMLNGKMGKSYYIIFENRVGQEIKILEFDNEKSQEEAFQKICSAMKNGETYCDLNN